MDRALVRLSSWLLALACSGSTAYAQTIAPERSPSKPERNSARQAWRAELIEKGYYNPLAPKPFRIAIPLTDRDDPGPPIMLGFAPRLREVDGRNVILIFTTINLD